MGTYHTEMITLRDSQQAAEQAVDNDAALLEIQRPAAAMMYKNLGRIMEKYSDTPMRVEDFYDMNYIRDGAAAPPPGGRATASSHSGALMDAQGQGRSGDIPVAV